jgi:hypothetical protein
VPWVVCDVAETSVVVVSVVDTLVVAKSSLVDGGREELVRTGGGLVSVTKVVGNGVEVLLVVVVTCGNWTKPPLVDGRMRVAVITWWVGITALG